MRRIIVETQITMWLDPGATPRIPQSAGNHATFPCVVSSLWFTIKSYIVRTLMLWP